MFEASKKKADLPINNIYFLANFGCFTPRSNWRISLTQILHGVLDVLSVARQEEFATLIALRQAMSRECRKDIAHDFIEAPYVFRKVLCSPLVLSQKVLSITKLHCMHRIDVTRFREEAREALT